MPEEGALYDQESGVQEEKKVVDQTLNSTDGNILEEFEEATWGDVYQSCCVHSATEWGWITVGLLLVLFFLYWFMFSLELLGSSAKVLTGCSAGALFGDDTNPVAAVMIGMIVTVLLQSSSTTTSIIISLTGTAISVETGIYMVMGSNIGTVRITIEISFTSKNSVYPGIIIFNMLSSTLLAYKHAFYPLITSTLDNHKHYCCHGTNGQCRAARASVCRSNSPRYVQLPKSCCLVSTGANYRIHCTSYIRFSS
jgi:Na+/Pi-cotransporter